MKQSSQEYLALLAHLYLRQGKVDEALTILEGLNVLSPDDQWVHRTLAYVYLRAGQFQKSLDQLSLTSKASLTDADQVIRARALSGLGRREEARKILQELQGRLRATHG